MAFDPKWTVGWNVKDLYTVAQRNGFRVNVIKVNNIPTPLSTNWKTLMTLKDGPFINVCIEQKGSLNVVSNIIPDSVMNNREEKGKERENRSDECNGIDFRRRFMRDSSKQIELYRIPQRRQKKKIRITIRRGQIVQEEEEDEKDEKEA